MDLFADLKKIVEHHLTLLGITFSPAQPIEALILLALNHELKTVSAKPRTVHRSTVFSTKLSGLSAIQQQAAETILRKFERGDDVAGHLSKSSVKPAETDALLAEWKIHHLHISTHKTNATDTFFARTGPVMFAHISNDSAFFIDIYEHGQGCPETWTRQELLKILDDNWPRILDPYRLSGISSLTFVPSDMELKQLRDANVNSIVKVGNSFVSPPGLGIAMDGTPAANVHRKNDIFHLIKRYESYIKAHSAHLKTEIANNSGRSEAELDFELVHLDGQGFRVIEKTTRTFVEIG